MLKADRLKMSSMTIAQALKSGLSLTHKNLRLLLLQIILNAAALCLFYFFLRTTETSIPELIVSLFLAVGTLFIFSLVQAGTFGVVAQASAGSHVVGFFRQGIRNSWRFLLAILPIALLGYVLFLGHSYVIKKSAPPMVARPLAMALKILWYVILPLMLVTLWTSVARNGLAYSFKNGLKLIFRRVLELRSLLVYMLSFFVFAVVSYFLIIVKTPIKSPWLEFLVLVLRLGVSYVLAIYGWTVMAGAIASLMADSPSRKPEL